MKNKYVKSLSEKIWGYSVNLLKFTPMIGAFFFSSIGNKDANAQVTRALSIDYEKSLPDISQDI